MVDTSIFYEALYYERNLSQDIIKDKITGIFLVLLLSAGEW